MEQKNENSQPNQQFLLTRGEVAKLMQCTERKVDLMRQKEGLPFIKIGGLVRIDKETLLQWLKSKTVRNAET